MSDQPNNTHLPHVSSSQHNTIQLQLITLVAYLYLPIMLNIYKFVQECATIENKII